MNLPEIIRAAIEIGEANGAITFDQLNELIETEKLEPDDIESLFQALGG
jgi:sigma-70-like protein